MSRQWLLREEIPQEAEEELKDQPDLIRRILFYRGIKTKEEAEKFLSPDYKKHLYDPFGMSGMEAAVERILKAIKDKEKIVIFGDYDADGVCASVIFYDFFKKIGFENFHIHIPDRHLDGYGLTEEAINEFEKDGAKLLITLDCGITDVGEVESANAKGIDVIIIDHHLVQRHKDGSEKKPPACAVVDAKQEDDKYPFKFLCGAGTAFKVVQALIKKGKFLVIPGWEKWLLDLVAIATVADMVPLIDENRVLTYYGLKVLRKTRRPGLISFFQRLNLNSSHLTEEDIAFMIAPRINIASRMDHANTSFSLLTTRSYEEAKWLSAHLEELNIDRRKMVDSILCQIEERIKHLGKLPPIIVEGDYSWHPGVLGIAANRLLEKYERPVFLWGKAEAKQIKGSCRSDGSVNLVEFMEALPTDVFTEKGGHALAGGFSLNEEKVFSFGEIIAEQYSRTAKAETQNGIINIDAKLLLEEVNWDLWSKIESLRPFGVDNPTPLFLFEGLEIAQLRKFGNGGIHLSLGFKKADGSLLSAIGFFMDHSRFGGLAEGQRIDLVASLEKSTYRSIPELRMRIIDIKPH